MKPLMKLPHESREAFEERCDEHNAFEAAYARQVAQTFDRPAWLPVHA